MQMIRIATVAALTAALASFAATSAGAQIASKQIKLTERHVEGFIAAQKDLSAVVEKMHASAAESKFQAELEAVTKKHGFKDFSEYEDVAANISMLMAAIDPQTKVFTDPPTAIRKEIDEVSADKGLPEEEKKQLLQELNEALKAAQPIQFPSNVELVKKYYEKIDAALG
jgi:hypothetical protein